MLDAGEIFTLFFVTLGPLKLLGPFAQRTRDLPDGALHRISWLAFVIAAVAAVAGGLLGDELLIKWHVSLPALMLAGGIIFLLVALKLLLEQYAPGPIVQAEPLPPSSLAAASRIVFPIVLTPYGIAAVIALLARSTSAERMVMILAILLLVMVFDLLAMWFVRRILVGFVPIFLQVLGSVLAVLQVAYSIEFILRGLRDLGIIAG